MVMPCVMANFDRTPTGLLPLPQRPAEVSPCESGLDPIKFVLAHHLDLWLTCLGLFVGQSSVPWAHSDALFKGIPMVQHLWQSDQNSCRYGLNKVGFGSSLGAA